MAGRRLTLIPLGPGEPFVPTSWWRYVESEGDNIIVDDRIEIPGSEPVGISLYVNIHNRRLATPSLDPNSFTPRQIMQSIQIAFRNRWLVGAIEGVEFSVEAAQDLRGQVGNESDKVATDVEAMAAEKLKQW